MDNESARSILNQLIAFMCFGDYSYSYLKLLFVRLPRTMVDTYYLRSLAGLLKIGQFVSSSSVIFVWLDLLFYGVVLYCN